MIWEQYIMPEKLEKWREIWDNTIKQPYNSMIIAYAVQVMQSICQAQDPITDKTIQIGKKLSSQLSSMQVTFGADLISNFCIRGEDYRNYWNRKHLPEDKAREAKGVANPNMIIINCPNP